MLRSEANIASSLQLNEKWSTVILGHFSIDSKEHDGNNDGFRDEPLSTQFNFANRWLYLGENGVQIRFGIKALKDKRTGGQMGFSEESDRLRIWRSNIVNNGINGYFKVGIPLNPDGTGNIAVVGDYVYYKSVKFCQKFRGCFGFLRYN